MSSNLLSTLITSDKNRGFQTGVFLFEAFFLDLNIKSPLGMMRRTKHSSHLPDPSFENTTS